MSNRIRLTSTSNSIMLLTIRRERVAEFCIYLILGRLLYDCKLNCYVRFVQDIFAYSGGYSELIKLHEGNHGVLYKVDLDQGAYR